MGIIEIIFILLFVGFILFMIRTAPMIDAWIKNLIYGLIVLALLFWLLHGLGFVHYNLHL